MVKLRPDFLEKKLSESSSLSCNPYFLFASFFVTMAYLGRIMQSRH